MLRRQVAIIGAGPVGLAASMYMEKMGVSYALIERNKQFISHPAAHLINLRSMETLSEIMCKNDTHRLHELIYKKCEDINYFRYYRYQRRLCDKNSVFCVDDHFAPNPDAKQQEILTQHAFARYVHLPQPHFVEILKDNIKQNENIFLGHSVVSFQNNKDSVYLKLRDSEGKEKEMQTDYLLACDGKHSMIRNTLGIGLVGTPYLQTFLNIYFHSPKLAKLLDDQNENAMLHFIYNSNIIACLVNHSKREGMFVMQIPVCLPYDNFMGLEQSQKDTAAKKMILDMLEPSFQSQIDDIDLKSTGLWKLSSEVIERYYQGRVIFAGDSAHAFPPAGGFGMNTGLQEIHCLSHKFRQILKSPESAPKLLEDYNKERKQFVTEILNTANKYYKVSLNIAKHLGLNVENYFSFKKALDIASPFVPPQLTKLIWKYGVKAGSYPVELQNMEKARAILKQPGNTVPLIFYKEDTEFKYDNGFIGKGSTKEDACMSGLLLPHIIIKLQGGQQQLALRQLPEYALSNQSNTANPNEVIYTDKQNPSPSKNLIMIALLQGNVDKQQFETFINRLDELYVKPDEIVGIVLNENNCSEQDRKRLFNTPNQFILVRSDAHIFGRYTL